MTADDDRDLMPATATPFEKALSATGARILDLDQNVIRRNREAGAVEAEFLASLAWERSVHHWAADEATQRARTDASFADHGAYGRPDTLEGEIVLDVDDTISIVEFFEDDSLEWPDFAVVAPFDQGGPAPDVAGLLPSALQRKNVRDWPSKIRVRPRTGSTPYNVGSASRLHLSVRSLPENTLPPPPNVWIGSASRLVLKIRVLPL